jgi:DNA-directed RNA polymerase specialized sigma subunit
MRPKPNFPPLTDEQRDLVERHAKLASAMAYRKLKGLLLDYNVSLSEAQAIAYEALCRSAQTFDPDRNIKFISYAARLIRVWLL